MVNSWGRRMPLHSLNRGKYIIFSIFNLLVKLKHIIYRKLSSFLYVGLKKYLVMKFIYFFLKINKLHFY